MTSAYETVVAADADRLLQHERRRRVADPGGVVDVVAAQEADELLGDVVRLVGEPAGREVHAEAVRPRGPEPVGDEVERVVPAHAPEAALALAPHHRVREAPEVPELLPARRAERLDVGQHRRVERAHRVHLQQVEPRRAQVDAGDRPVVEPGDPERAPVADAPAENPPRVPEVAAVLPHRLDDFLVVVGLRLPRPVRLEPHPRVPPPAAGGLDGATVRAATPHVTTRGRRARDACSAASLHAPRARNITPLGRGRRRCASFNSQARSPRS